MCERQTRKSWWMLGLGVTMGLLVGVGMVLGVLVCGALDPARGLLLPETVLNASSTHGDDETMTIATGMIDEGMEGLFVLDHVTGVLRVLVVNPRTGSPGGFYQHRVTDDLGSVQGKTGRLLMVTGTAQFRSFTGNYRPAQTIVYVADANTGMYAGYLLPWDKTMANYNAAQVNPMQLLFKFPSRAVDVTPR